MKNRGGIVILVLIIFGFFSSYSSLAAEKISNDIASFRTEFHRALDKIKKAKGGKTPDLASLSGSISNMEKISEAAKQRITSERKMGKGTKSRGTADEAALKEMMDQVKREMNAIKKQKTEQDKESVKEHLAKIMDMIKELLKLHEQITERTL